jgi:erythronate-4-phosphate dehydrogenase
MKILADQAIPLLDYYFAEQGSIQTFSAGELQPESLKHADILLVRSTTRIDAKLLSNANKLQFIGSCVTGVDHLDETYLRQQQIAYYAAQGCNAQSVVEYVLSVIAALQLDGKLPKQGRAAVIGVGRVGQRVANLLRAIGYTVQTCDPLRITESGFTHTPLAEISDVDLICAHTPLTEQGELATHNMLARAFFQKQKPGCVLLNAGRGEVINEPDLLQYGSHLVCCLDVFANEPKLNKALVQMAYIATPHIAGHAAEAKIRGTDMVYQAAAQQFGWAAKAMPTRTIEWQAPVGSWQEQVLSYSNPRAISQQLQANPQDFAVLRAQYQRHEFRYVTGLASALILHGFQI